MSLTLHLGLFKLKAQSWFQGQSSRGVHVPLHKSVS
jgi:hypothetical protein